MVGGWGGGLPSIEGTCLGSPVALPRPPMICAVKQTLELRERCLLAKPQPKQELRPRPARAACPSALPTTCHEDRQRTYEAT